MLLLLQKARVILFSKQEHFSIIYKLQPTLDFCAHRAIMTMGRDYSADHTIKGRQS